MLSSLLSAVVPCGLVTVKEGPVAEGEPDGDSDGDDDDREKANMLGGGGISLFELADGRFDGR